MGIKWKKEYSVSVKKIDMQHKHFIAIINKLIDNNGMFIGEKVDKILSDLIDYANIHFKTEEELFKKTDFPGSKEHISEHRKFTDKMMGLQKHIKEDYVKTTAVLLDFLEEWFLDHLRIMDSKYVECFKEHGIN